MGLSALRLLGPARDRSLGLLEFVHEQLVSLGPVFVQSQRLLGLKAGAIVPTRLLASAHLWAGSRDFAGVQRALRSCSADAEASSRRLSTQVAARVLHGHLAVGLVGEGRRHFDVDAAIGLLELGLARVLQRGPLKDGGGQD